MDKDLMSDGMLQRGPDPEKALKRELLFLTLLVKTNSHAKFVEISIILLSIHFTPTTKKYSSCTKPCICSF